MKKLTKAQEKVIEELKSKIDFYRNKDTKEYAAYVEEQKQFALRVGIDWNEKTYDRYNRYYTNGIKGIVFITANTRTLTKLQELGLIKILKLDGSTLQYDQIQLLNY